jgi:hypothetical protein
MSAGVGRRSIHFPQKQKVGIYVAEIMPSDSLKISEVKVVSDLDTI